MAQARQLQACCHAMDYARKATGDILLAAVPVCTDMDRGHVFGIEEWLLPMIITQLGEARAVSLVRSLHRDYDQHKLQKVLSQWRSNAILGNMPPGKRASLQL